MSGWLPSMPVSMTPTSTPCVPCSYGYEPSGVASIIRMSHCSDASGSPSRSPAPAAAEALATPPARRVTLALDALELALALAPLLRDRPDRVVLGRAFERAARGGLVGEARPSRPRPWRRRSPCSRGRSRPPARAMSSRACAADAPSCRRRRRCGHPIGRWRLTPSRRRRPRTACRGDQRHERSELPHATSPCRVSIQRAASQPLAAWRGPLEGDVLQTECDRHSTVSQRTFSRLRNRCSAVTSAGPNAR